LKAFYICYKITRGSINGQEAPKERKGRLCRKSHIVLDLAKKSRGEKSSEKEIRKEILEADRQGETYRHGELSFFP
jgi:hypothetical protein